MTQKQADTTCILQKLKEDVSSKNEWISNQTAKKEEGEYALEMFSKIRKACSQVSVDDEFRPLGDLIFTHIQRFLTKPADAILHTPTHVEGGVDQSYMCVFVTLACPARLSESAMWCSTSTRRDIRETSMRRMNASNSSGGKCRDERDMPSERLGMTVAL
jgi:hypothetical protein